ncbi:unnamed protein product [marine sediment metagenome]|uniref:Uncharacterized protein n=1 Tax=marine sediment metagenome TaxID=412755 RepID=X1QWZ2_9ZZZZ
MLTVFQIDGVPEHIYFTKAENFEQVLTDRNIDKEFVKAQEVSMETLLLLTEGKSKVFILCLYVIEK